MHWMDMKYVAMIAAAVTGAGGTGGYVYDQSLREATHEDIRDEQQAMDVELNLRLVEAELKLLRTIEERRGLSADELDRRDYLLDLRSILIAEQRGH